MKDFEFTNAVEGFIRDVQSQHVRLVPSEISIQNNTGKFVFDIKCFVEDKYTNGQIVMFQRCNLSPQFEREIEKYGIIYFGQEASWNNDATTGWFIISLNL